MYDERWCYGHRRHGKLGARGQRRQFVQLRRALNKRARRIRKRVAQKLIEEQLEDE